MEKLREHARRHEGALAQGGLVPTAAEGGEPRQAAQP